MAAGNSTRVEARAPGKLAVLGEYAVLCGAPALVFAVNRYARAAIGPSGDGLCRLETRFPEPACATAASGSPLGVGLVDMVVAGDAPPPRPWHGLLDSREFFAGGQKLGLGSSAAALCAWVAAWRAWCGGVDAVREISLVDLVDLHRRFQRGAGSGLDVAAAFAGGVIEFRLDAAALPHVGSVRLPNGVAFAGIFAGRSASTPDLVALFNRWRSERPNDAAQRLRVMEDIAEGGCAAARQGDGAEFLCAVDHYGRQLDGLGQAIGAEIVTAEHHAIGAEARRFGVTYKVSGAGGGDVGLALSLDCAALQAFERCVREQGYQVVQLQLDGQGWVVEELAE